MTKLIFDPLYGYIELEDYLLNIIDTPEFQRLRDIKQLGCASYVFPSATHTRFEHSLGVSYLCGTFIKTIKENQPELGINDNDIRRIKIGGLIHDLGHSCYSHFFDHYFLNDIDHELKDHENRSIFLLKYMNTKYELGLSLEDLGEIEKIIFPKEGDGFKYSIVCNEKSGYDCDKLDYLNRDCHHLGLPYKYDYTRILKQIRIIDNQICFPIKQMSNVYELFELRYKLHQQIYQHPVISSIEMMVLDIFKSSELNKKKMEYITYPEKFILLTDDYINRVDSDEGKKILGNIKMRKLYKNLDSVDEDEFIGEGGKYKYKLKIKINFGKGDRNPLEYIYFYESGGGEKVKIDIEKYMMLIPTQYQIIKYRFIY
jgi:HD superfamily phosphohydrolase